MSPLKQTIKNFSELLAQKENSGQVFFYALLILLGLLTLLTWLLRPKGSNSQVGRSEAELRKKSPRPLNSPEQDRLAHAKLNPRPAPLQLGGISIHARPHEILGIAPHPTVEQIQKAYKERMKQYHPDKISPPGSPQWNEAQKLAEAINRARNELLAQVQKKEPVKNKGSS